MISKNLFEIMVLQEVIEWVNFLKLETEHFPCFTWGIDQANFLFKQACLNPPYFTFGKTFSHNYSCLFSCYRLQLLTYCQPSCCFYKMNHSFASKNFVQHEASMDYYQETHQVYHNLLGRQLGQVLCLDCICLMRCIDFITTFFLVLFKLLSLT